MDKDKLYTEKDEERFLSKIEIDHDSGCWLWQAYTNHAGYGQFRLRKTTVRAHRVMFATWIGNIPDGYEVDHLEHAYLSLTKVYQLDSDAIAEALRDFRRILEA